MPRIDDDNTSPKGIARASIISGMLGGLSLTILVLIIQAKEQFVELWFFALTGGLATLLYVYSASSWTDEELARKLSSLAFFPFYLLLIAFIGTIDSINLIVIDVSNNRR